MFKIPDHILYRSGVAVFAVKANSKIIEKWCEKIRMATGALIDWHYMGKQLGVIRTMPDNHQQVLIEGIKELKNENPFFNVDCYIPNKGLKKIQYDDHLVMLVQAPVEIIKIWCETISFAISINVNWRYCQGNVGIYIEPMHYKKFVIEAAKSLAQNNPFYIVKFFYFAGNYAERESSLVQETCFTPINWGKISMSKAYEKYFSK